MKFNDGNLSQTQSIDKVTKTLLKDSFILSRLIRSYTSSINKMSFVEHMIFNYELKMDIIFEAYTKKHEILMDEYNESKR